MPRSIVLIIMTLAFGGCAQMSVKGLFSHFKGKYKKYICSAGDVIGNHQFGQGAGQGLEGEMYLPPMGVTLSGLGMALDPANATGIGFYLSNVQFLSQPWAGFSYLDQTVQPPVSKTLVHPDTGQPVVNNFGLMLKSNLKVASGEEGYYSFAAVASDGVRVAIDGNSYLVDDGNHTSRVACAANFSTAGIPLGSGSFTEIDIDYYKADVDTVSLSLWFRAEAGPSIVAASVCGQSMGDITDDLEDDGYQLVPSHWFHLDPDALNPCQ